MKKKIICMGIVSMFLLTSLICLSVTGMETSVNNNVQPTPSGKTVTLYGYVYEAGTHDPVGGVTIQRIKPRYYLGFLFGSLYPKVLDETISGYDGYYEFENFPAGMKYILLTKDGYQRTWDYPWITFQEGKVRHDLYIRK